MVRENIVTMAAKQEAVNGPSHLLPSHFARFSYTDASTSLIDWQEYVHTYFQKTVFSTKCASAVLPSPRHLFNPFFAHSLAVAPFLRSVKLVKHRIDAVLTPAGRSWYKKGLEGAFSSFPTSPSFC